MEALIGHKSPETAYVISDYPYGFRLRCKIRYWIETKKHGQRLMTQTTNPKIEGREVWNKPKASTYSPILIMYLDEKGHVKTDGIGPYSSDKLEDFVERWGGDNSEVFTPYHKASISLMRAAIQRMKGATWTVTSKTYDPYNIEGKKK